MSITKETRVTLRKVLVNDEGFETRLERHIHGALDQVLMSGDGLGDWSIPAADVPALIAGLQELMEAE